MPAPIAPMPMSHACHSRLTINNATAAMPSIGNTGKRPTVNGVTKFRGALPLVVGRVVDGGVLPTAHLPSDGEALRQYT